MKVVILCGGKGTRLREETEFRPKPMVPVGNRPILWHIMKTYAHYGHKEFILCLGYKGDMIKEYFRNYLWNVCDSTIALGRDANVQFHDRHAEEDWSVTLAETGEDSMTAYRVKSIQRYVPAGEPFLLTYGDGLSTIDINASIAAHKASGKTCTLSAVHPAGRFGASDLAGRFTLAMHEPRLLLTADLATHVLDIVDAGPFIGYSPQASAAGAVVTQAAGTPRILPDAPLRVEALRNFDAFHYAAMAAALPG